MRRPRLTAALLPLVIAASSALSGCISSAPISQQAAEEQICLHHHEHSPEEQARCRLDPGLRGDRPPDMMPQQLPVRVKGPGD